MTSNDVNLHTEDSKKSSNIGFAPIVLPKANSSNIDDSSHTGVSTFSVPTSVQDKHWYALRATYGREKKAYEYIMKHGGIAFYPTMLTEQVINGKKQLVEISRLPNIFFAYGTLSWIESFVFDNINLPYLRFYYKHTHQGSRIKKQPLIVPDQQIDSFRIICNQTKADVVFLTNEIKKFRAGEHVRVIEGSFKGVEGIVARFLGQQRVGVVIDGLLTAITAYVPTAFLEKINIEKVQNNG